MKRLPIKELVEAGYLQEVNRLFFHPLGLALAVERGPHGEYSFHGVFDAREDPEGWVIGDGVDEAKARRIAGLYESRGAERSALLGWVTQPIGPYAPEPKLDPELVRRSLLRRPFSRRVPRVA